MATILTPGFVKWDGRKYVLDPSIEGSLGPTITNSGTGTLGDVASDENEVPAAIIAFTGASDMAVSGIVGGVESREIKLFNTNAGAKLTLKHEDISSSVSNRIICPNGGDFVVSAQEGVQLIYSNIESRWRVTTRGIPSGILNDVVALDGAGGLKNLGQLPTVASIGPTITNASSGTLSNVATDSAGTPADLIGFTSSSPIIVTGFAGGTTSRRIYVFNVNAAATLTLKNEDSGSSLTNRIICPGGVDFVLNYRETAVLVYSTTETRWRVIQTDLAPGGTDQQLQFNNNGSFGGITNWSTTGANRIHVDYHLMTGGPALTFDGANQITRGFGTWTADNFKVGDIVSIRGPWYNNSNVPQTPLNIINTTVTNVTSTTLTITATISPAGYALAGEVFIEGGGLLTGGYGSGQLPDSGVIRIPTPSDSFTDTQFLTTRDSGGDTVPLISISSATELMIGGTFDESNLAAGVTNRRPVTVAMWGGFNLDFTDERVWRDDKGSYTNYLNEFRATITTTNNTPTQLLNKTLSSLHGRAFIEILVTATQTTPTPNGAAWRFFGSTATTADWQTPSYYQATAGASTWACSLTGTGTITVTGATSTSIKWKVYGRYM